MYYDRDKINLGDEQVQTGHTVYTNAGYQMPDGSLKAIVFKENKQGNAELSRFEAAFSGLAGCFLAPNLTPEQLLVKDDKGTIVGLASEHFKYAAARREGLTPLREGSVTFYSLDKKNQREKALVQGHSIKAKSPSDIPIHFLNQFKPGYFARLWHAHKQGELVFDMNSLASVLTSSYTLEEDDLHKGNFGFYLVKRGGKIHVVFFKIDNDLMLADSVMSRCSSRIVSWGHGEHAFDVTKRDLIPFPKLYDSQNHYWPTSKLYLANPIDNKVYSSADEIRAFTELGNDKEFQQAKWREFYKHILIPPAVIEQALALSFNQDDPADRAQIALVMHAVIARQARLRAVLFTIPEFRSFVHDLDRSARKSLKEEILYGMEIDKSERRVLANNMIHYQSLCQLNNEKGFADGDTPMHVALRLKDYRYHETWQSFSKFADQPNSRGEKPLDLVVAMVSDNKGKSLTTKDVRQDPFFILKSLLKEGVSKTEAYRKLDKHKKNTIKHYQFGTSYLDKAGEAESSVDIINLLRDIGEDHRYSLKMKKELSVATLRQFIRNQRENPDLENILTDLKEALNGKANQEPAPELQYIRQLRSRLWIVRQIRGLLGGTATQVQINGLIDNELKRLAPPAPSCFSFFFSKTSAREGEERSSEKQKENSSNCVC